MQVKKKKKNKTKELYFLNVDECFCYENQRRNWTLHVFNIYLIFPIQMSLNHKKKWNAKCKGCCSHLFLSRLLLHVMENILTFSSHKISLFVLYRFVLSWYSISTFQYSISTFKSETITTHQALKTCPE